MQYFNDYQDKIKEKYIIKLKTKLIKKDNKIDNLEEKMNILIEDNKETKIMNEKILKNNEELIKNNKETKIMNDKILKNNEELLKSNRSMEKSLNKANYKLDETLEKLDEVHEELENTHEELEDTNEKLDNTDKTLKIVVRKLDIAVEDRVVKTKSNLK